MKEEGTQASGKKCQMLKNYFTTWSAWLEMEDKTFALELEKAFLNAPIKVNMLS